MTWTNPIDVREAFQAVLKSSMLKQVVFFYPLQQSLGESVKGVVVSLQGRFVSVFLVDIRL